MTVNLRPNPAAIVAASVFFLAITVMGGVSTAAAAKDRVHALYIPAHRTTQRNFDKIVHYATLTPVNAVVLHVKNPMGKLSWPSCNAVALRLAVGAGNTHLEKHVARLKKDNIRTIAKLDVFADHQLASAIPELSVMDRVTDMPWTDANGLHWSNPGDSRVWEYNIALAKELARMGFDEIQFDYVRFPSDGDLSCIRYPDTIPGFSKSDCIESFLEKAYEELKPMGVCISADIFGLTAWKSDDFGVGQVLEKMAPHLDVICPMFYPSHFPPGFLGKKSPGEFPELIMEASTRSMMKRTDKAIRPWVQGFWYRPPQIVAQIDGIEKVSGSGWSIWSPTGRYGLSYQAMADRSGVSLTRPQLYPSVTSLATREDRSTRGHRTVVNYTCFAMGYSILSLEEPEKGKRPRYASPAAVLSTLEEGIVDHILENREISFHPDAEPCTKKKLLSDLLCADLEKDPRRMRPTPFYIDWAGDCTFSEQIPESRLDMYAKASRQPEDENLAVASPWDVINIASITEEIFGGVLNQVTDPALSMRSQ